MHVSGGVVSQRLTVSCKLVAALIDDGGQLRMHRFREFACGLVGGNEFVNLPGSQEGCLKLRICG